MTFDGLMDAHGPALRALLRHLCRRPQDVDDVWQETALRVWRSLHKRPWLRDPRAWLATIAYRATLDHAARQPVVASEAGDRADHASPTAHDVAVLAERRLQVRHALAALPAESRALVALHYTAGLSLRETAAALGLPVGTVKSRLHAALNTLRGELE